MCFVFFCVISRRPRQTPCRVLAAGLRLPLHVERQCQRCNLNVNTSAALSLRVCALPSFLLSCVGRAAVVSVPFRALRVVPTTRVLLIQNEALWGTIAA